MIQKMKNSGKLGFTMAELLIVVAIIAVLVAVAIPVFTSNLDDAQKKVSLANLRSAYAEASADALVNNLTSRDVENVEIPAFVDATDTAGLPFTVAGLTQTMVENSSDHLFGVTFTWVTDASGNTNVTATVSG